MSRLLAIKVESDHIAEQLPKILYLLTLSLYRCPSIFLLTLSGFMYSSFKVDLIKSTSSLFN